MKDREGYIDISGEKLLYERLSFAEPSVRKCLGCGRCVATCVAAYHGKFNFRKVLYGLRRGSVIDLRHALESCTLCGKCTIICPYGVNAQNVILTLNAIVVR